MRRAYVLVFLAAVSACKDPPKGKPDAATGATGPSASPLPPPTTPPVASTTAAPSAAPLPSLGEAGTACRLEHGAVALPLSGPAALYARKDGGVDVVQNDKGAARLVTFAASAKDLPQAPRADGAKSSSVPCALTEKLAFCTDPRGAVHRIGRDGADQIIGTARLGTRVAAADLSGHAVAAFIAEGATAIAQLWSDDGATTRLSDEGQGATFVDLAPRAGGGKDEVLALTLDGHMGMSPVHARTVSWAGKPVLGTDVVLWVGGNAESSSGLAIATGPGSSFALVPFAKDTTTFGMLALRMDATFKEGVPEVWSAYPNGLDPAPIAATHLGKARVVARVRPDGKDARAPRVLELGTLEGDGTFGALGLVPTRGAPTHVAVAGDKGALWLSWVDDAGAWLERRACP